MSRMMINGNVTLNLNTEDVRTLYSALSYTRNNYAESADWYEFKGEAIALSYREQAWDFEEVMKELERQSAAFGLLF